jgi:cytochrome c oxidase cbb3-type subunit 2
MREAHSRFSHNWDTDDAAAVPATWHITCVVVATVTRTREEILEEIQRHRTAISSLEQQLRAEPEASWPPAGFYLTYYVVAGTIIGIIGSLTSFIVNVVGSLVVNQDPLRILRVYGTVFLGARALTTDELDFFMLVAVVHFSVGAAAGAVFHVLVNRFVPPRASLQIALGAAYGVLMWVVNFYLVIAWLQPRLVGEAWVLTLMPTGVALLTHVVYGLTLGLLQPLGRFVAYRPATVASLVLVALVVAPTHVAAATPLEAEGAQIYARYCVGCHGADGDGHGPAADMLITKPRDFTKGLFKFRSTPSGSLPTDQDLFRVVTRGVYRTSMPEWSLLTEGERWAVIAYVKGFYPEWSSRGAGTPIFVPQAPATLGSPESVARGRQLYELLECSTCHGNDGRGDGPSVATIPADAWGNPQHPADFTKGRLKSGAAPEDVYRTFMTGLNGTAMPSYFEIFAEPNEEIREGDTWNLVSYVLSLRGAQRKGGTQ